MAQNSGTCTLSISDALKEHRQGNGNEPNGRPIDLATAIISIDIDHQMKKAEMLIGDHSLKPHQCARMQFWRLNSSDMDKCIALRKGDIVRFNGVTLRKDYTIAFAFSIQQDDENAELSKLSTVLCDFHHSFQNPNVGASFGKIATVTSMAFGRHVLTEANAYNSLVTPRDIVDSVAEWFQSNHPIFYDEEENHHNQKRKLRELTAPNMLSDIVVRVLQMDIDEVWRKQQWNRYQTSGTRTLRVILIDGDDVENEEDSIPFFIEETNPLLNQLRRLFRGRDTFLIRQVLTKKSDFSRRPCNGGAAAAVSDLTLVPTSKTTIEAISSTPSPTSTRNIAKRLRYSSEVHAGASLSPTSGDDSERSQASPQSSSINGRSKVLSSLSCIHFDGLGVGVRLSKCNSTWPTPLELSRMLVREDSKSSIDYRPATLTINAKGTTHQSELHVKAHPEIMSVLCGDRDPARIWTNEIASKVSYLLKGMISLEIPLDWTLMREHDLNVWYVEDVSLPSLDF